MTSETSVTTSPDAMAAGAEDDEVLVLTAGSLLANCSLQDTTQTAALNHPIIKRAVRRNALANLYENMDPQTIQQLMQLQ